jgi:hypothetical protein
MNLIAAAEFYEKHSDDFAKIKALLPAGPGDPSLAADIVALITKHFPQANPNNLLEDTLALIKAETA